MSVADFVREAFHDPLGFVVLSYLLGTAVCGAWAAAAGPLRAVGRRRKSDT